MRQLSLCSLWLRIRAPWRLSALTSTLGSCPSYLSTSAHVSGLGLDCSLLSLGVIDTMMFCASLPVVVLGSLMAPRSARHSGFA